jgi:hypothetical protein
LNPERALQWLFFLAIAIVLIVVLFKVADKL